ncbi:tyrosine-protein phosphatase 10D isoform X3 [Homalodisca vitripennis]|nr:tyrosine-protein phosphatase 10D isoform X3 [Homalodisca vitripennis]
MWSHLFCYFSFAYLRLCICSVFISLFFLHSVMGADLVIRIPDNLSQDNSSYRLAYSPPHGVPPPNTTIPSRDIGDVIQFSKGLPGTRYEFWLYYSNNTLHDWLTWTASITTAPDPAANLSINVRGGKSAVVSWNPPALGHYSGFKMKVLSYLDKPQPPPRLINLSEDASPYTLRELTPGGSYQIQLYTVFDNKESSAYISRNFTTKPNTPGKFIVWFRNETTLLVLWQPSYPASIYTHYKVSIDPPDAQESVLYVEKEGEPPGPAQAAFKGLIPGRAYNISVQTVSEDETSTPTTAQYRTIPLRPLTLNYDKSSVTHNSFKVHWEPPKGVSEFDKYQVVINVRRQGTAAPITRNRDEMTEWEFKENLEPGRTYHVLVKTVSGKVTSWPAAVNVTVKPLPVVNLRASVNDATGAVILSWQPDNSSFQEEYKVSYSEVEILNGDSNSATTTSTKYDLDTLLPGRNYSITVQAVSSGMESNETTVYQATRPSSPIIEDLRPVEFGLNISWKSDVNSRQDKFEVVIQRNDTGLLILGGKHPVNYYKELLDVTYSSYLFVNNIEEELNFTQRNVTIKRLTKEYKLSQNDLFPGSSYLLRVFAISHNLRSEPHDYPQAVYPLPPTDLVIEKKTSNAVIVKWKGPIGTVFTHFLLKYTTDGIDWKIEMVNATDNEADLYDMVAGERYTIQVNTVSGKVESKHPLQANHTVHPKPVSDIAPLVGSTNLTMEFPRPGGRIERYEVSWAEVTDGGQVLPARHKNMTLGDEERLRAVVEDLMPGVRYNFEIHTVSYDLHSDITSLTARTLPLILSEVLVVNNQQATDSVTLRYTPTPLASSHFDLYRFSLSDPTIPVKEKLANDSEWKVTFNSLVPGRLYNITMWTVAEGVASQPLQRQDRLYPEPITAINATDTTDTTITLTWDTPRGEYNAFEVQYLNTEGRLLQNLTVQNMITITDLKPHRNYTFTVVVRSGTESSILRSSLPVSAIFTTEESFPGKVEKFEPTDVHPGDILFEWSLPNTEQNGVIRKFTITYGLDGSTHTQQKDFKAWEFSGSIKGLIPGKTYIFRIQAETRVGYGPEAVWKEKMPILAPPRPSSQVVPTEVCRTSVTIQIRFRKNYFSDVNGVVIAYTVIVAEDDTKNASGLEMPSWRDVQAYSIWPPYQVMERYNPFKNSSIEDLTIGAENCEGIPSGYCNGPLKPGTTYRVKIRAFTTPDKFTDTYYSFPITTDNDNTAMVVGVGIPVVMLIVLVLTIVLIRRRNNFAKRTTENRVGDNMSLPDSIIETSRPVHLEKFAEHYRLMSADSDFRFSEEFEELKHVGRDQPCTAADLPCNRPKNRFTNILPYDHSRFKLQPVDDEEGSDYINANYVPGYNSPREFIVTQGPLHSTRDDFWRMCWESNSRAIIMLTRCIEKGREKCDHYWPYDTLRVFYGDIAVTILNECHYPDWSITEMVMCRGDQNRVIRHFHFTTWPDFGVPNPPQTLVRFVRAFRDKVPGDQRPIVVHCSAGVGRSGTLIALDRILQQLHTSDVVDIYGIVWQMRKERVWMVQTEQQYICIHQCLLAVLEGNEGNGNTREIHHNQGFEDDEGIAESGM